MSAKIKDKQKLQKKIEAQHEQAINRSKSQKWGDKGADKQERDVLQKKRKKLKKKGR